MPKESKAYTVGYGKPPIHTRFRKGESGNPNGKKKGQKSLKAVVEKVFRAARLDRIQGDANDLVHDDIWPRPIALNPAKRRNRMPARS
jgi:hypothetical protein